MTPRGKIAVLISGTWLYGTVNRGEFAKAIAPESHRTFKLRKTGWRGGPSVVVVKGSHVAAWDWLTPPARRKRPAPGAAVPRFPDPPRNVTPAEIADEDREALASHMAGVRG